MAGTVMLGGQPRELRYPWKAIKRLKAEHGINLLKVGEADFLLPETISALVWAGLIWENAALTVDQVDEWIDIRQIAALGAGVAAAMKDAMAGPDPNP